MQEELLRFLRVIVSQMKPHQVLLFGSLATDTVDEWSDLDLVVITDTTLPFYDRIKYVITQFRPRVGIDVLVYTPEEWDTLAKDRLFVKEEIIRKGKVVYERRSDPVA